MKPTGPQLTLALFLVSLVGYVFVVAPALPRRLDVAGVTSPSVPMTSKGADGEAAAPQVFPPDGKAFIGVTTREGAFDLRPVDAFSKATAHKPAVMMFTEGWAVHHFNRSRFDKIATRGMLPMLSWEPWKYLDGTVGDSATRATQPRFALSKIIAGQHDDYIRSYAEGIKGLDYQVAIRLAHEMNGSWYPWGVNVNSNRSGDYVKMWKHVRGIFEAAGTDNITWVWSANVNFGTGTRLGPLYPGDDQVDWVGLSGYYGIAGPANYRTPQNIFDSTIEEIRSFSKRPIVITETAATNVAGFKARWVSDFFRYLPDHPEVIGFVWYEAVKETDWRIIVTPDAARAFATGANDPAYDLRWAGDMLPRTTVPDRPAPGSATPSASTSATPSPSTSLRPSASPGGRPKPATRPPTEPAEPAKTPPAGSTPTTKKPPANPPPKEPTPATTSKKPVPEPEPEQTITPDQPG